MKENKLKKELQFYYDIMKKSYGEGTTHVLRKKIKYISRTLFYYPYSMKLASFLMEHPHWKTKIYYYPALSMKLHKPYMTYHFSMEEKLHWVLSSYQYLDSLFSEETLKVLYEKGELKILDLEGKEEEKITVYFHIYHNFDKEGECNLVLYEDEILLGTLTFSLSKEAILIGGLQGLGRKHNDPEILKKVTKNFYGLFPKRILLEVFYHLFPEPKIAVGNANHIYLAQRYRYKKERKVKADYDEFWESLGGVQREDGLWKLAEKIARKPIEEIPSKKRSQYRSRYQILDTIQESVSKFLIDTK